MTHSRTTIHQLLERGGLAPRRDLGQNFVADPNTVRRIAALAGVGPGDHVIEIGAGLGSLTLALADTGAEVVAMEVDHGVAEILRQVVADRPNVAVLEEDAMEADWDAVTAGHEDWTLVANLPYNVATPLVCDLLDEVASITRMVVMVQKEVAERFAAEPGSRQYGAVSVKVAFWAAAKVIAVVPPAVFVPRPNVESALVRIERRTPPDADPEVLFSLVRQAFGQRRKMLRRSLHGRVDHDTFLAADLAPDARPEQLDVDAWVRLSGAVSGRGDARVSP